MVDLDTGSLAFKGGDPQPRREVLLLAGHFCLVVMILG
jgi:hypothetical protein